MYLPSPFQEIHTKILAEFVFCRNVFVSLAEEFFRVFFFSLRGQMVGIYVFLHFESLENTLFFCEDRRFVSLCCSPCSVASLVLSFFFSFSIIFLPGPFSP